MKYKFALGLFFLLFISSIPASSGSNTEVVSNINPILRDSRQTLRVDGRSRNFLLHLPPTYDGKKQYPLVIMLHGGGGNYKFAERMTGFSKKADQESFIVAYPNGSGRFGDWFLTWNAGDCCGYAKNNHINDIAFLKQLIDSLISDLTVDQDRIYLVGFSNGAMLSYEAANELSNQIAAMAVVSGSMTGEESSPSHPLPVIIFHGTADDHVPYEGGIGKLAKWGYPVNEKPVSYAVSRFISLDHCLPIPRESIHGTITRATYAGGIAGSEVVLYTIAGFKHAWPGGIRAWVGADSPKCEINATDLIWDFFKDYSRSNFTQASLN